METKPEIINANNSCSIPKTKKNKKQEKKKVELIIDEEKLITEPTLNSIINKGTGAGGANTNYYGKKFEEKTNNQIRLLNDGYIKNSFTKKPKKSI